MFLRNRSNIKASMDLTRAFIVIMSSIELYDKTHPIGVNIRVHMPNLYKIYILQI